MEEKQMDGLLMKYFVLRPKGSDPHAEASRVAMRAYAAEIRHANPQLADDLTNWANAEKMVAVERQAAHDPLARAGDV